MGCAVKDGSDYNVMWLFVHKQCLKDNRFIGFVGNKKNKTCTGICEPLALVACLDFLLLDSLAVHSFFISLC